MNMWTIIFGVAICILLSITSAILIISACMRSSEIENGNCWTVHVTLSDGDVIHSEFMADLSEGEVIEFVGDDLLSQEIVDSLNDVDIAIERGIRLNLREQNDGEWM